MRKLRPYQQKAFDEIVAHIEVNDRCLVHGVTGFGKTVLFGEVLKHYRDMTALVLVHRSELKQQAQKTIAHGDVIMVMTARSRKIDMSKYDIVIVDEAHRSEFNPLLEGYKGKVIGFTATPYNTVNDGTYKEAGTEYYRRKSLSDTYHYLISTTTVMDLVEQGFLSKETAITEVKKLSFKIDSKTGDYNSKEQKEHFSSPNAVKSVRAVYDKYNMVGQKVLVFCNNILVADKVGELFPGSKVVHSKASGREEAVEWFRNADEGVLINVDVLTTGLDVPDIDVIIINRSTASPVLYTQIVGRGGRISEGKNSFTVVDLGGNVDRFGTWSNPTIDWSKLFYDNNPKVKSKDKDPILKVCINKTCGAFIHPSVRVCKYCGENQTKVNEVDTSSLQIVGDFRMPTPEQIDTYIRRNKLDTRQANIFRIKILVDALRLSSMTREEVKANLHTGRLQYRAFLRFKAMMDYRDLEFDPFKKAYKLSVRLAKKAAKIYSLEDSNSNWLKIRFLDYTFDLEISKKIDSYVGGKNW